MNPDDAEYRRNARNMAAFVGLLVVLVAGSLAASVYLFPHPGPYPTDVITYSPSGYSLNLVLNSTSMVSGASLSTTVTLNNTSPSVLNLTSASSWRIGPAGLQPDCGPRITPIALGVLRGYFSSANYTSGALVAPLMLSFCPHILSRATPEFFLLEPFSSNALISYNDSTSAHAELRLQFTLHTGALGLPELAPGLYTFFAADEWGDVALTHLRVA